MNIELKEGETYVGRIDNTAVILLPGDNDDATFEAATEWAKSIGGDLPNRVEQAVLLAKHRDQFKKDWYWSNETHQSVSGFAWAQTFEDGGQDYYREYDELRARAVRRLIIE